MIHNNEAQTQQSYPSFPHAKVLNWPQQQSERCKASLISQVVFALANIQGKFFFRCRLCVAAWFSLIFLCSLDFRGSFHVYIDSL